MPIYYEALVVKKASEYDSFGTPARVLIEVADIYTMTSDQYEGQVLSIKEK